MSTGTTLAMATALAGLLGIGLSQEQTAPTAKPGSAPAAQDYSLSLAGYTPDSYPNLTLGGNFIQGEQGHQRVSAHFENASAQEVISWLTQNGVSFAISEKELPKDKINLNVVDQPISDVLDAIADAMGGAFVKKGGIYVFHEGIVTSFDAPDAFWKGQNWTPKVNGKMGKGQAPGVFFGPDQKELNKLRKMDELHGQMPDVKFFGQGDMKVFGDGNARVLVPGDGKVYRYKMDTKDMQKAMEELKKQMPQMSEEIRKAMEEARKNQKDGAYVYSFNADEMKKAMEKMQKEMPALRAQLEKEGKMGYFYSVPKEGKDWKVFVNPGKDGKGVWTKEFDFPSARKIDFAGFVRSLTPDQKKKQERQGYLRISDLTPNQRKTLGLKGDERNYTLSYSNGADKVVIKSDK